MPLRYIDVPINVIFLLELDISMKVDSSSFGLYILVTEKKAQLMKRKELLHIITSN